MTDSRGKRAITLPINAIKLAAQQPRRYFDPEKLAQLTESVKHNGILENLLVRPLNESEYELVVGERRYRAAQEAGLTEVPVKIKELTDEEGSSMMQPETKKLFEMLWATKRFLTTTKQVARLLKQTHSDELPKSYTIQ